MSRVVLLQVQRIHRSILWKRKTHTPTLLDEFIELAVTVLTFSHFKNINRVIFSPSSFLSKFGFAAFCRLDFTFKLPLQLTCCCGFMWIFSQWENNLKNSVAGKRHKWQGKLNFLVKMCVDADCWNWNCWKHFLNYRNVKCRARKFMSYMSRRYFIVNVT